MPKKPSNKAADEFDLSIYRRLVPFNPYQSFDASIWRAIARRQPVIMDCITAQVQYIQGLPFGIRAKDPTQSDELKDDIVYHLDILNRANGNYLNYVDLLLQDFYMIPFGAASEVVRYSDGRLYSVAQVDGGTLYPTSMATTPVVQIAPEVTTTPVYFTDKELIRMYQSPRPELMYRGWGMAQPEKIYLAIELLNRGDKYYAELLLDTPEAGILDLGDMSAESAKAWLKSFRELFTGIDGFKIPVLYEHTTPANYIQFRRGPNDLMYDTVTLKYAQLVCAAFGLTLGDIGIKPANGSLSSDIRDERHSKSTGKAMVKAYLRHHINSYLPPELEFWFIDTDDELLVSKGRARSANAVAGRNLIESGALSPKEWRKQLQADGLVTIPLREEPEESEFDILHDISGLNDQLDLQKEQIDLHAKTANQFNRVGGQAGFSLNKARNVRGGKLETVQGRDTVPVSQGGQGEIKSLIVRSQNKFSTSILNAFNAMLERGNDVRYRKIIKSVFKNIAPVIKSASVEDGYAEWLVEYNKFLFGLENNFGDELTQKSASDLLAQLVLADGWWKIALDDTEIGDELANAFLQAVKKSANELQQFLYEEGLAEEPELYGDPELADRQRFYERAVQLESLINHGTEFYLKRLAAGIIAELVALPEYKETELSELINRDEFVSRAATELYNGFGALMLDRIGQISEYELKAAYNEGVIAQYRSSGLASKASVTTSSDPCENCLEQEALGFVPLDYVYPSKMGETAGSPFHVYCQCEMRFNKDEARNLTAGIKYFTE